jgi:hypothetical protein
MADERTLSGLVKCADGYFEHRPNPVFLETFKQDFKDVHDEVMTEAFSILRRTHTGRWPLAADWWEAVDKARRARAAAETAVSEADRFLEWPWRCVCGFKIWCPRERPPAPWCPLCGGERLARGEPRQMTFVTRDELEAAVKRAMEEVAALRRKPRG